MSYVKQFEGLCCHYVDREEPTRYINQLKHSASASEVITVDLETTGLDPLEDKIALIGIVAHIIPVRILPLVGIVDERINIIAVTISIRVTYEP